MSLKKIGMVFLIISYSRTILTQSLIEFNLIFKQIVIMLSKIVESELNKTLFFKRYIKKSLALTIKQKNTK